MPRRMILVGVAALAVLALIPVFGGGIAARPAGAAGPVFRTNSFSTDPNWEAVYNRPDPAIPCQLRSFNFGWSNTKNAGGAAPGEIGGQFMRSITYRASYGMPLAPAKTLADPLVMSGTLNVTLPTSGTALFGWFNSQSKDWRANNFLGLRINGTGEGSGSGDNRLEIFGELGTPNNFGIDDLHVGRESAEVIPAVKPVGWTLAYLPATGSWGTLQLTVKVVGKTYVRSVALSRIQRLDGITLDRFGFLTSGLDGEKPMMLYVDDLVVNGVNYNFTTDPLWEGSNNHLAGSTECAIRGRNDFGYSATAFAGSGAGEIGGLVWHSSKKATYADVTATLGLRDVLYATGKIVLKQGNPDSDLLVGWFNSTTKDWPVKYPMKNVVAGQVGGITDTGFRIFPTYRTSGGAGKDGTTSQSPMLTPKGGSKTFWICYRPPAVAGNSGSLTVGIDAVKLTVPVLKADVATSAALNRFGIINYGDGNGAAETFYLDDLRYTVAPGDSATVAQCGA